MRRNPDRDRARFERLYEQTYPAVCGYVLRRTDDPADAADAVAETYLTLWRRLGELHEEADARLWLYGVARRVLANQRRTRRRSTALTQRLSEDFSAVVGPTEPPDRTHIAGAFRRLSDSDRELLALVGWEGLDRDQIAKTLGVSKPVVRLRLHRARQRFARELDQDRMGPAVPPVLPLDRKEALS